MKIGIDVQTTLGQKTGFGFYVNNLVKNLKKIDKKNKYSFFKPDTTRDLSAPKRFIWDQFEIVKKAMREKVDILHQPTFSAPILYNKKVIVTCHDLIALLYGKDIPFWSRQFFGRWMPFSYKKATKIICISENTKKDLIKLLKIKPEKIKVIHLAAADEFRPISDTKKIEEVKKKYKINGKYFLHIGTLNPRKNLEFLIKVFNEIIKSFSEYKLVITGKKGWYFEGLFNLVKDLKLSDKVVFTGYIEDQDAPYLYNGSELFLFPSFYEGFGLPPLEAMSCGIPVISSNTSSMPEVVADAGILLSPTDQDAWVKSAFAILNNSDLREILSKKGLEQAKNFSWKKCAQETLKVYEEVNES